MQIVSPIAMTAFTAPAPYVVDNSSNYSTSEAYRAFNSNIGADGFWTTNTGLAVPSWTSLEFGDDTSYIIGNYSITRDDTASDPLRMPMDWELQGSNNGTDWDIIDTVTGETDWAQAEKRDFVCDVTTTPYKHIRIYITANNGGAYTQIAFIQYYELDALNFPLEASNSIELQTDSTKIDEDLTNFPLAINISNYPEVFTEVGLNSKKIAVTTTISENTLESDGSTEMKAMISASSEYNITYHIENAFDGVEGTNYLNSWISGDSAGDYPDTNGQCWVQFDYGISQAISEIRFRSRPLGTTNNSVRQIRVLTSDTGDFSGEETDLGIYEVNQVDVAVWSEYVQLEKITYSRYIRIEIHSVWYVGALKEWVAINEISFKVGGTIQNPVEIECWEASYDDETVLLIHSDTIDGSVSFTDSSDSAHIVTPMASVHHEIDQAKFGSSSINFIVGDFLQVSDSSDFDLSTGDWTIDLFLHPTATDHTIFMGRTLYGGSYPGWYLSKNTSSQISFSTNDNALVLVSTDPASINTWTHVAVTYASSVLRLFVDGVLNGETTIAIQNYDIDLTIGRLTAAYDLHPYSGYMDEIRVSKGIARWTDSFTPPTAPYIPTVLGTQVIHTKIPLVSSSVDTIIKLWYDNSLDDNTDYVGDTGSEIAKTVWDEWFVAVYHMAQDPSGGADCILDSTSNVLHGTPEGSMLSEDLIDGEMGKAINFDGSDDNILVLDSVVAPAAVQDIADEGASYTIESATNALIEDTTGSEWRPSDVLFELRQERASLATVAFSYGTEQQKFSVGRSANYVSNDERKVTASLLTDYLDTYAAVSVDSSDMVRWILNEVFDVEKEYVVAMGDCSVGDTIACNLRIGARSTDAGAASNFFIGVLRELRLSSINRSDAWLKATNYTLKDELVTVVAEAPIGDGYNRIENLRVYLQSVLNNSPLLGGV